MKGWLHMFCLARVMLVLAFACAAGSAVAQNAQGGGRIVIPQGVMPQGGVTPEMINALVDAALRFQPKGAAGKGLPAVTMRFSPADMAEIGQVFSEVVQVIERSGARRTAHLAKLKAQGIEEEPMSQAGVAFEVNVLNNRFAFDRYGELYFDDRFVKADERPVIKKAEELYRRFHKRWMAAVTRKTGKPMKPISKKGVPAAGGSQPSDAASGAIVDRVAEWHVRRVPVFRGFEDDRYQEHDALIVRFVDEFNRGKAEWAGATADQAKKITPLTTALVKSHMIEETGGHDPKSLAAWDADPLQVNVPGDWSAAKFAVGLKRPQKRNEGSVEQNIKAAIRFLARKGFGVSGQPAANRPTGKFDDWQTALRRYNGRNDKMMDGRRYSETYADHIMMRAKYPDRFVAIQKKVKK